jgi:hypothetical protein
MEKKRLTHLCGSTFLDVLGPNEMHGSIIINANRVHSKACMDYLSTNKASLLLWRLDLGCLPRLDLLRIKDPISCKKNRWMIQQSPSKLQIITN